MICMICHDSNVQLIKICFCNESLVCESCLKKLNFNRTDLCPICREPLRVEVVNDSGKKIKIISKIIFFILLITFVDIYPIFYFISINNETHTDSLFYNKSFQYVASTLATFIVLPLLYFQLNNFLINRRPIRMINKDATFYITVLTIANLIYSIVLSVIGQESTFFLYYFASIIIPFYILPFGIMIMNILSQYLQNVIDFIEDYSKINLIQSHETILI